MGVYCRVGTRARAGVYSIIYSTLSMLGLVEVTMFQFFFFYRVVCSLFRFIHGFHYFQAEELSKLVVAAREEVTTGAGRRAKLRSAASAAVRVLELTDADIGPGLATLLYQVPHTAVDIYCMYCLVGWLVDCWV